MMTMQLINRIQTDLKNSEHQVTKTYRNIAKSYKHDLHQMKMTDVFILCEELLKKNKHALTIIAYQIIFDQKKRYDMQTFDIFQDWLYTYISDWWDCDDFMTHAFAEVLNQFPECQKHIKNWIHHETFAVRRSAAVVLVKAARHNQVDNKLVFDICDLLIDDPHYLVQKGYGWLLKEYAVHHPLDVIAYIEKNVSNMPRVAFRYALEKLSSQDKKRLMAIKKGV